MGQLGSMNMRVMCQLHSSDIQHNEKDVFFQKKQTKHQTQTKEQILSLKKKQKTKNNNKHMSELTNTSNSDAGVPVV